mgnify:CR=1 FL=1
MFCVYMAQIMLIHGGMTFQNKTDYLEWLKNRSIDIEKDPSWSGAYLDEALPQCQIIRPRMPLRDDAKYEEWKIFFERHIPLLEDGVILIGTSLGGIFLAKYLSENRFPKKVRSVYLLCPPFDDSIPDEDLVGGFELGDDLSMLQQNAERLTLFFSKDDPVVPPNQAEKYRKKLPDAEIIIYESKNGHFRIAEFPELIEMIQEDVGGMHYNKLVRDNIPAIIEKDNRIPKTHIADEDEYRQKLRAKLIEEAKEYAEDGDPKELADVCEVLNATYALEGIEPEEIETLRKKKAEERGGFQGRIILDSVE